MDYRTAENLTHREAAEILIGAHDGDCALLYIWKTARNSSNQENAARDLCLTMAQIRSAEEKLQRMGLSSPAISDAEQFSRPAHTAAASSTGSDDRLPIVPADIRPVKASVPLPAEELPEVSSEDIAEADKDPAFSALKMQLSNITGKLPTKSDLSRLLGIYRHLGMAADVIFVLFTFCDESTRANTGLPPTMNFIERQAYLWVNRGISTVEEAELYAEKQKALRSDKNRIKNILEIYDRKLTANEERYIESWLAMGFEDEALRIAYERTVEKAGQRSVPYMNRILQSWNEAGLHTVREIEEKDPVGKGRRKKHTAPVNASFDPGAIDRISITKD